MIITIETIPHASQRYDTVGDWIWEDENYLRIRVSSMRRRRYAALVAVHELVEALLCWERGITTEMVDTFDKAFEAGRPEGNEDEPGDDPTCPYRREHFFATTVERLLAAELRVDWTEYERSVNGR